MTVADLGEAAIIERIRRRTPDAPAWVPTGIGDDAAVVEPARGTLDVVTTDTLVEGVHFDRSFVSAADVGHRALAVNLSDLAAMGATPRVAVLSLVLPGTLPAADLDGLVEGLLGLAAGHRVALVGGNVTRTHGPLVVDVTTIGAVRRRRVLTRDGGQPGDELWVTGAVGTAAAGLAALQQRPGAGRARPDLAAGTAGAADGRQGPAAEPTADGRDGPATERTSEPDLAAGAAGAADGRQEPAAEPTADADLLDCIERYRRPEPRVRIGILLGRNRVARAGIDLSDGLADGLRQLARASGLGAAVDAAAIPVHPGARRWFAGAGSDPVEAALRGSDDYELLIAVSRRQRRALRMLARLFREVPITRIGELTKAPDLVLRTAEGERPVPGGYEHFRDAPTAGGQPA